MPFDGNSQRRFSYDRHFHFAPLANLDAASNVFFQRELEHIIPEIFDFQFARINARRIFPIDRSAGGQSKSITWRQFTKTGQAQIIADYADDLNIVNAEGEEFTTKVRGIAIAAQWSMDEIRTASAVGRPLERMYAEAAREAMMRLENNIAFAGSAPHGVQGLFSAGTGIPENANPNGVWDVSTQALRDDILEDMHFGANTIVETTGDVEIPNTMLLPTAKYNLIASTKHGVDSDTTILKVFLNNSPYITEVLPVRELADKHSSAAPVMVCYDRNPSKVRMQIPLDLEQLAPQQRNLAVFVPYHMKIGGITVHKPASLHIVTGI